MYAAWIASGVAARPANLAARFARVAGEEDDIRDERDDQHHQHQVDEPLQDEFAIAIGCHPTCERPWRGSRASRSPSPSRLNASVVRNRAMQGKTRNHHAIV